MRFSCQNPLFHLHRVALRLLRLLRLLRRLSE